MADKPLVNFKAGVIQVALWRNEREVNGTPFVFIETTLSRQYKDKEGNWKATHSLRVNDIPKAIMLLQKAYEHIIMAENKSEG